MTIFISDVMFAHIGPSHQHMNDIKVSYTSVCIFHVSVEPEGLKKLCSLNQLDRWIHIEHGMSPRFLEEFKNNKNIFKRH